jgi:hypothetical protein
MNGRMALMSSAARSAPWIVARLLVEKSPVFFLLFTGRPILPLAVVA